MNMVMESRDNDDLAFFGRVNASISHELKNIMAIISETAGLLQDLTEMATRGKKIELETLSTCTKDIVEEIQRGFVTIKEMNRFAHSMDTPLRKADLNEILDLMIHLAGFLSFASEVRFDHPEEPGPTIYTCPFRLQNLIYQALVFAFESAGPQGEIHISIQEGRNGSARIVLAGLGSGTTRTFPDEKTKSIAESIKAEILMKKDSNGLDILVPENMVSTG